MCGIVEWAEKVSPVPLDKYQKQILCLMEKAHNEDLKIMVCYPIRCGRTMILRLWSEWIQEKLKQDGITVREDTRHHRE